MGFVEAILVLILVAVVVILVAGLFGFANPDDTSEERRNRLMRLRVIAQAVAVGLLAVLVYLTR
ncbi:MAG: twin transmembrane helix small protein [Rhodospirillales bacterium]|jgi:hypothetical protein|nr:twin transmembrane helix small protein [Rhodospirillales bacterium]MDP6884888.1 twin transmembrane helix small protein [Rhodospirillales bacterium]